MRSIVPDATIADQGTVTRYRLGRLDFYLLWLGDSMTLRAPDADAAATAALAQNPTPLARDERMRPLLAKVGTAAPIWFVADPHQLGADASLPLQPESVWGTIDEKAIHVTVALASKEDATRLASMARALAAGIPLAIQPLVEDLTIDVDGAMTVITLPYTKAYGLAGIDPKTVPPVVGPHFAAGRIAGIAIPAFLKNAKMAKSTEARINVKRLYEGAFAEYGLKHKLPKSTGITPPLGTCCAGKR